MTSQSPVATTTTTAARNPRAALVVAAVVAAIAVLEILLVLVDAVVQGATDSGYYLVYAGNSLLFNVVPHALGVFLLLWLWPADAGARLLLVLARGLAAAFAGVVVSAIATFGYQIIASGLRLADYGALPISPFAGVWGATLALAPLVMLVVLAQWVIARGARL